MLRYSEYHLVSVQVHHRHISGGVERRRCRWHCRRRPLCHWDGPRRPLRHEEEERHPPHGDYHPHHLHQPRTCYPHR